MTFSESYNNSDYTFGQAPGAMYINCLIRSSRLCYHCISSLPSCRKEHQDSEHLGLSPISGSPNFFLGASNHPHSAFCHAVCLGTFHSPNSLLCESAAIYLSIQNAVSSHVVDVVVVFILSPSYGQAATSDYLISELTSSVDFEFNHV